MRSANIFKVGAHWWNMQQPAGSSTTTGFGCSVCARKRSRSAGATGPKWKLFGMTVMQPFSIVASSKATQQVTCTKTETLSGQEELNYQVAKHVALVSRTMFWSHTWSCGKKYGQAGLSWCPASAAEVAGEQCRSDREADLGHHAGCSACEAFYRGAQSVVVPLNLGFIIN